MMKLDKETEKAWDGWVTFTKAMTFSSIVAAVVVSMVITILVF